MKSVLITGASTGIGYDTCRYLLAKGFYIFGTVRKDKDKIRLAKNFPENFEAIFLDVTDDESIAKMVEQLKKRLADTGLYGLINNAGIAKGGPLIHLPFSEFELQMNINFYSVFKITNGLASLLGAGIDNPLPAGRIINISSVSGLINTPMIGPYCISKHALESMSDIYRRELALYGIKLILLEPGPIKTPIWKKSTPKENPVKGTDFENSFTEFAERIRKTEERAIPVSVVSKLIYTALTVKNPRNRYIVGQNKLIIRFIQNLFPSKWLDRIFLKQLKSTLK